MMLWVDTIACYHSIIVTPCFFLLSNRFGFRTDAPSGRSARRPLTSSEPPVPCSPLMAWLISSTQQQQPQPPWAIASVPFTPMTPAGRLPECRAFLNCNSPPPWAGSRPWLSPCPSAALELVPLPTPWACPPTAPGSSHTSTSPAFQGWCPAPCLAPLTWPVRPSFAAPRRVTCGEGRASHPCAARH